MKHRFVAFHTMMRDTGKPAYVVRCAKALAERNIKVLVLDGLMYEQGAIQHQIYEILGATPVIEDKNNLYDLIHEYELLCSSKGEPSFEQGTHRGDAVKFSANHPYPDLDGRVIPLTDWPSISYLPGNNGKVVEVKARIDFHELYEKHHGHRFFNYVKSEFAKRYDVVLINAPAGHQEISGILCGQFADLILAIDMNSPVVEPNASFEACKKLAQRVRDERNDEIEVKSIKGHELEEVIEMII